MYSFVKIIKGSTSSVFRKGLPEFRCIDVDISADVLLLEFVVSDQTGGEQHVEFGEISVKFSRLGWVEFQSGGVAMDGHSQGGGRHE